MEISLSIEKLDTNNIKQLKDFLLENARLRFEHFYPHPFDMDYLVYLLLNKTKDYYCMMIINNKVVAYGMLRGWEEGYEIPSLGVAVDENFRGKGLGKLMCEYLRIVAKLKGSTKIRLRVHKDNIKAINLYKSLGYEFKEEIIDDLYEGFLTL